MTGNFPRALVIDGNPFSHTRNTGIVKSPLFAGWPKERLCQITGSTLGAEFDICERYWHLTEVGILRGFMGCPPDRTRCEMTATQEVPEPNSVYLRTPRRRGLSSWLNPAVKVQLSSVIYLLGSLLSPPLRKWVDDFSPEVIFTFGGSVATLRLAALIADRCNINVVIYFGDDWISTLHSGDLLGPLLQRSARHWLNRCLTMAPVRLTPTEAMAREYEKRFGGSFEVMHYALPVRPYALPPSLAVTRLLFVGTMVPDRWPGLKNIGRALDSLALEGVKGELIVYSYPDELRALRDQDIPRSVKLAGTAPPTDVARLQSEANILVHVESFDKKHRSYTRLSLSTKIPQYFMAGRCVFGMGPEEGASIQYISETDAGVSVTVDSVDKVKDALRFLIIDRLARQRFGERAYQIAVERNNVERVRERFRELICDAARDGRYKARE